MTDEVGVERIFLSAPDVGQAERDALLRAFDSGWVAPAGPELDAFEAELGEVVDQPGVVALASGTAALHLALVALDVGPGDDVLVSSFTFAASANAVTYVGARPVFVDSDRVTWNMSPQLLADELAERASTSTLPAAVVVVDLYGQCADYEAISALCRQYEVPLIEDAAEALGATSRGRPAGSFGDAAILSFNGNKIVTTSGGGAFVSSDVGVADRVRYLATQARQAVVHYEHTEVGYNYRLSNLLAALGRAQLARLPQISERRLGFNARYREALAEADGVGFMPVPDWNTWNGWLTCVTFDDPADRDRVQAALASDDIESRPLWKPMHLQPAFASSPSRVDGTSDWLFGHGLCLPSGSAMSDSDLDRVLAGVRDALGLRSRP
jgi:dTDP-4-amino-4,6-dideoxygalactose transaminase